MFSVGVACYLSATAFNPTTQPLARAARTRRASDAVSTIAVFGASGGVGSEVVLQAIKERGEDVSCLVRNRMNLEAPRSVHGLTEGSMVGFSPSTNEAISVVQGTVLNRADVDAVFEGKDITGVVVAIGGKTRDVGPTLLQDGTVHIIAACQKYGVKRVAVVSTVGAGDSMDQAPWAFKLLMNTVMKTVMLDKNAQEKLFLDGPGAELDYCLVRPGGLKMGEPTGIVDVTNGEAGAINRADLASFCLDVVTDPDFQHLQQAVCISSDKGSGFNSLLSDKSMSRMGSEKKRQKYATL